MVPNLDSLSNETLTPSTLAYKLVVSLVRDKAGLPVMPRDNVTLDMRSKHDSVPRMRK